MKKLIDELLEAALQCDISVKDFWDMTYLEVIQTIRAYEKKKKLGLQERASMVYQGAQLVSCFMSALYSKKAKLPTLSEAFPTLFEKGETEDTEDEKANIMEFVERHNRRLKHGRKNEHNDIGPNKEGAQPDSATEGGACGTE